MKEKPTAQRCILVVDDNADAAFSLVLLLRELGHRAEHAFDGRSALLVARSVRPDIVFLDLGLPDIDGYEIAMTLRAERGRDVRLIALTGRTSDGDRHKAAEAGFDNYLVKPIDTAFILSLLGGEVGSTLNGHRGSPR